MIVIANGEKDTITDFNRRHDKIQLDIVNLDDVASVDDIYEELDISVSTDTNDTGGDANDTIIRFDLGPAGHDDSDYLLVLQDFTRPLEVANFDLI